MNGPLLFGAAVGLCVFIGFVAMWRLVGQRDPVDDRLRTFGVSGRELADLDDLAGSSRRPQWSGTNRMLAASGLGPRLAISLAQADVPLTSAEFMLIALACFLAGFFIGALRLGPVPGLVIGLIGAWLPTLFLNYRRQRRQRDFTAQLPEVMTLLVGALRAGYGLNQAMNIVVKQLTAPASVEFGRVIRAVALGLPLQRALNDMALRIGTDEANMVVTAINVQYETGGNLAQTLDTIGETVRERLRTKDEIRALTSSQRLTGYILAALPIMLALAVSVLNPAYLQALFAPGLMRLVVGAAVLMQIAGFLVIRRIVDIEV
jgi:tight adherence protein B